MIVTHYDYPKGIAVSTLTGTRKQQIKTIAPMGAVSTFTYDALGQLLSSSDPCQHATTYTYDMLGRMIQRVHPDAGTDTYTYDGAGNVTTHSTQVLANANKTINYYYSYNRLDSIVYPTNRQNNVRYTYGDSTATHNQRGRIALMEDASGYQTFFYGRMGEVTENNRTFVLPNESQPYSFKMKYAYDSWNRIQNITYPDGEIVYYQYNTGGMLRQVYGRRSFTTGNDSIVPGPFDPLIPRQGDGPTADDAPELDTTVMGDRATYHNYYYYYIDSIRYNEFEMKSGQWYGNGTHAHYRYDILQRLDSLKLYDVNGCELQKIKYTYDKANNITQISNAAGTTSSLGGQYSYSYTYDSLYRLTSSYGSVGSLKPIANYSLNMQYEADGRIMQKDQSGRYRLNGTTRTFNDSKSYTYNTSQPHTVHTVGSTSYQWDANGNMVNDGGAVLTWDEENRLTGHSKSLKKTCFFYDAAGERYYKNSGSTMMIVNNGVWQMMTFYENPTLYASPYVVATPDGYTKHYYVESERFASRIGDGTITGLNTHAATASVLAAKQAKVDDAAPDSIMPNSFGYLPTLPFNWSSHHTTYWQHSDHLGSASWVTDTNGTAYQHLQYMPWGEPLLDQRKSGYTYNTRYTFSGKERDEETGYSYFGARYYHSTLSIWLSVDPMADKYPSMSPYTYCADNPVKLVDPDGRELDEWDFNIVTGEYKWVSNKGGMIVDYINVHDGKGTYLGCAELCNSTGTKIATWSTQDIGSVQHRGLYLSDGVREYDYSYTNNTPVTSCLPLSKEIPNTFYQQNKDCLSDISMGASIEGAMISNAATASGTGRFLKVMSSTGWWIGVAGGLVSALPSIYNAYVNPTIGNVTRSVVQIAAVGLNYFGPWGSVASLGLTVLDYYFGDYFYNWLDE